MFLNRGKILNYLNKPWREQFELPSFDKIRINDFLPALHEAIALARDNIEQIVQNKAHPNFSNTVEALEKSDVCLLYTSPSPRDGLLSRMPSSA